ncbi:hypothetical protein [Streptomyces lavendulae]|uniref:hypothetical protein n=1 Tax=Streptomyces lavendulae TaxID=1914 RepID=UPI0036AE5B49
MPIADLARIALVESITEPHEGDPLPATRTLMVVLAIRRDDVVEPVCRHLKDADGQQMKEALDTLLSEVGIPVQLQTQRTRRPKPPPSGSAHVGAIVNIIGTSGGPGSGSATGSGGL